MSARPTLWSLVTGTDATNLVGYEPGALCLPRATDPGPGAHPEACLDVHPMMGVDVVLNQADVLAHLIAEEMSLGDMMTLLKLGKGQYALVEEQVHPRPRRVGSAIRDLPLPSECAFTAIIRRGALPGSHVLTSSCNRLMRFWRWCMPPRHLSWLPSSDALPEFA